MASRGTINILEELDCSPTEYAQIAYVLFRKVRQTLKDRDEQRGQAFQKKNVAEFYSRYSNLHYSKYEKPPIDMEKLDELVKYVQDDRKFIHFATRELERLRASTYNAQLSTYSDLAVRIVNQLPEGKTLDSLYIKRQLEDSICEDWKQNRLITIAGTGGSGKTSLLYGIYKRLKLTREYDCYLLGANILDQISSVVLDGLVGANNIGKINGRKQILLIDTLDVLLHMDVTRMRILVLLNQLLELENIHIVISCRIEEAQQFINGNSLIMEPRKYLLDGYNIDFELPLALAKYAAMYLKEGIDRTPYVKRITEKVADAKEAGKIYTHPLTLRMIFEIYSQNDLNEAINVYRLYKDYWLRRVVKDVREEGNKQWVAKDHENLGEAAKLVALKMFQIGLPVVPYTILADLLNKKALDLSCITLLVSRGILQVSEVMDKEGSRSNIVSFFHQTFFEHVAAQAIQQDVTAALKENFVQRLFSTEAQANEPDFFRIPVLNHLLYIASNSPSWVIQVLTSMFSSSSYYYKVAGLRLVPCLEERKYIDPFFLQAIVHYDFSAEALKDYLQHIGNTPLARVSWLWKHLDAIWQKRLPSVNIPLLAHCKWLALIEPENFKKFIDHHQPEQYLISYFDAVAKGKLQNQKRRDKDIAVFASQANHELIYILEPYFILAGIKEYNAWALDRIGQMLVPKCNHPFVLSLLGYIKTYLERINFDWATNTLVAHIDSYYTDKGEYISKDVLDLVGDILCLYWKKSNIEPSAICLSIDEVPGYRNHMVLNGLAKLFNLIKKDQESIYNKPAIGESFLKTPYIVADRDMMVTKYFWKPYLQIQIKNSREDYLTQFYFDKLRDALPAEPIGEKKWKHFGKIFLPIHLVCDEQTALLFYRKYLFKHLSLNDEYWQIQFNTEVFEGQAVRWIAFCIACGQIAPKNMIIALKESYLIADEVENNGNIQLGGLGKQVAGCLKTYRDYSRDVFSLWLQLSIVIRDVGKINDLLKVVIGKYYERTFDDDDVKLEPTDAYYIKALKDYKAELASILVHNLISGHGVNMFTKLLSVNVWPALVRMNILPYECAVWEQLVHLLSKDNKESNTMKGHLLGLYIYKKLSSEETEKAIQLTTPYLTADDVFLRSKALQAMVALQSRLHITEINVELYLSYIDQLLVWQDIGVRHISSLIMLLEKSYEDHWEESTEIWLRFLQLNKLEQQSSTLKDRLPHMFVAISHKLVKKMTFEKKHVLADMCKDLPLASFNIVINALFFDSGFVAGKTKSDVYRMFNMNELPTNKYMLLTPKIDKHIVIKTSQFWDTLGKYV